MEIPSETLGVRPGTPAVPSVGGSPSLFVPRHGSKSESVAGQIRRHRWAGGMGKKQNTEEGEPLDIHFCEKGIVELTSNIQFDSHIFQFV